MNAKKVAKSIETIISGLEDLKDEILSVDGGDVEVSEAETPKAKKSTKKTENNTQTKKSTKKETKVVETEEDDSDDYASMKYNDLKKLAVERGMKSPNVSKEELIAFLSGEAVSDDDEDVEAEAVENETDEEDLTEKVTKLLEDVETEDIAGFLTENGISAKGKRPSLIAKIVSAIEDGDLALEDLEVEDEEEDEEEDEPKSKSSKKAESKKSEPKKSAKAKKKVEPEPEEDEDEDETSDDDEFLGYVYDEDEEVYINEDEENELLAQVVPERMNALKEYLAGVEKGIKKKAKRAALIKEVSDFFGDDYDDENDDLVEFAAYKFLLMTDDEGETHEMEEPYEINETPVCCGQALTETEDGFVCEICESEYDADDE